MGYSAACLAVFRAAPKAAATRYSKPGPEGARRRKTSRGTPTAAAVRRISARRIAKSRTANAAPPKSCARIDQSHSPDVGVLATALSSINGVCDVVSIASSLTLVSHSRRNDAADIAPPGEYADVQPACQSGVEHGPLFALLRPEAAVVGSAFPIRMHRLPQRNPMLRSDGCVLRLVPFELHVPQSSGGMVIEVLTGGRP